MDYQRKFLGNTGINILYHPIRVSSTEAKMSGEALSAIYTRRRVACQSDGRMECKGLKLRSKRRRGELKMRVVWERRTQVKNKEVRYPARCTDANRTIPRRTTAWHDNRAHRAKVAVRRTLVFLTPRAVPIAYSFALADGPVGTRGSRGWQPCVELWKARRRRLQPYWKRRAISIAKAEQRKI